MLSPDAHLNALLLGCPELAGCADALRRVFSGTEGALRKGRLLLVCGNGGSAADAEHIVGELAKGFLSRRRLSPEARQALLVAGGSEAGGRLGEKLQYGLRAVSLVCSVSLNTAVINDIGGEYMFAQQVQALGSPGDVLWGLSTSGNAANVNNAMIVAKSLGMQTFGFSGATGGILAGLADACVKVPAAETYKIQEYHLPVYHALCAMLEAAFFP